MQTSEQLLRYMKWHASAVRELHNRSMTASAVTYAACCISRREPKSSLTRTNVQLQILEGGDPAEVERVAQLLEYVDAELLGNCNFEFLQVTGLP